MTRTEPPRIATWLLAHCTPGARNEALAGDLLEEFRHGRSRGWYSRQVLAAIAIACLREIVDRAGMLFFGVLWSMLAPGWDLLIGNIEHNPALFGPMWKLAWPWSTLTALGFFLLIGAAFIWSGMLLYILLHGSMARSFSLRRIRHGLLLSLSAFIAVSAILFALPTLLPVSGQAIDRLGLASSITPDAPKYEKKKQLYWTYLYVPKIDERTGKPAAVRTLVQVDTNDFYPYASPAPAPPTPLSEIKDTSIRAIVARLPYLFSIIFALWGVSPRFHNRRKSSTA